MSVSLNHSFKRKEFVKLKMHVILLRFVSDLCLNIMKEIPKRFLKK